MKEQIYKYDLTLKKGNVNNHLAEVRSIIFRNKDNR